MKLAEIKLNENNPRFVKGDKFEKLKKSIKEFPQMLKLRPIIIDENNVILGGNMRYKALIDLGYTEIEDKWVVKADELTEEQKKEFVIKDNVGFGEWDWELLANEWDEKLLDEWGLDVPDYGEEIDIGENDISQEKNNKNMNICPKCNFEWVP